MIKPHEDSIRDRAYYLWERAGSPGSHSQDFWRMAERELEDELKAGGAFQPETADPAPADDAPAPPK